MDGILIVNKSENKTSRDIVNKVCTILNTKKIGHTGTLDPIATGVLVLCIGQATKLVELLTCDDKEYIATMILGYETDTLDITGVKTKEKDFEVTEEQIVETLNSFSGKIMQEVPIYSAVKVNGKKLYHYARNNEEVSLPKREIEIKKIEFISFKNNEIMFRVSVTKGTYIRSLVRDIAYKLNTYGTMKELIRTKQGQFKIEDSYKMDVIEKKDYQLLSIEEVLKDYPSQVLDDNIINNKIKHGQIIDKSFEGKYCVFLNHDKKIVAIYQEYAKDNTKAKPYRMLI